ncbi:MAG: DNA polymerase I [Polyangiaceae bacterium]|nr:DNA polymerase I [Polyangiaceae bacterium]
MTRPTELPPAGSPDVLYLIDLSGYVFRAYHAIAPLQNAKGEPTHATYGTLQMIAKLIEERRPMLLAVAMESGSNFRDELDPRYKAHRPPAPPDLSIQMERCKQIVEAYRIPTLSAPGCEADDVIATLVRQALQRGLKVVIASADKDLMQLVGDGCVMWDAMRDRVYGPPEVEHKFGVPPERLRDLLALVGDTSDNVPGVPSVGLKTAAELLSEFGSLDELYRRVSEVKKARIKQSLIDNEAEARLSQQLVTLKEDAPVTLDKQALLYDGGDVEQLRALFTELGFTRQLAALPREQKVQTVAVKVHNETILDVDALRAVAEDARRAGRLALVLHSTPEDAMRCGICGLSLAVKEGASFYVPLGHRTLGAPKQLSLREIADVLGPILEDASIAKLGHDVKRAEVVLARHDLALRGVAHDAMLASYLLDPEVDHALVTVAERDAGIKLGKFEAIAPKQRGKPVPSLEHVEVDEASAWAGPFADAVLRLAERQSERLREAEVLGLLRDLELPLSSVLADLELRGVLVDTSVLDQLGELMAKELVQLEEKARAASGHPDLNVGSPRQLETILFDELGLKATKRTKTARSTDAEALEAIADEHPLPGVILEHRAIAKLKSTYVDALPRLILPKTGRIHGHWRQAVAATGRISSEEPNLQNIPIRTALGREIRKAFIAPPGCVFLSADYSQIELRVLAHLSRDPVMVEAFRTGQDIHVRTAMEVFGVAADGVTDDMRRKSKTINFGVIYGMGETALAKRLDIPRKQAAAFIEAYFERYKGVTAFMTRTLEEAKREGRVRTILGRLRVLPDLHNSDRMRRAYAERIAQNTPIQGTAADILKLAMVKLRDPVVKGARMVLTVHDELDFEVPAELAEEAAQKIRSVMESVVALDVPLVVDVGWGRSWAEAHG